MISFALLLLATAVSSPAAAEQADPECAAVAVPLPAELAGWPKKAPFTAATDVSGLAAAMLEPGKAVDLALRPTPEVRYALRSERPGATDSHGGMVAFTVPTAGRYRIVLGSAAWIDVVRDGATATSVAHSRGPACSGIRKMVDFALEPGRYVVQIVGSGNPGVPVMVARLP